MVLQCSSKKKYNILITYTERFRLSLYQDAI